VKIMNITIAETRFGNDLLLPGESCGTVGIIEQKSGMLPRCHHSHTLLMAGPELGSQFVQKPSFLSVLYLHHHSILYRT